MERVTDREWEREIVGSGGNNVAEMKESSALPFQTETGIFLPFSLIPFEIERANISFILPLPSKLGFLESIVTEK